MSGFDIKKIGFMHYGAVVTPKKATKLSAKNSLSQAKIASPYFGVNDFAFAYARA